MRLPEHDINVPPIEGSVEHLDKPVGIFEKRKHKQVGRYAKRDHKLTLPLIFNAYKPVADYKILHGDEEQNKDIEDRLPIRIEIEARSNNDEIVQICSSDKSVE